MSARRAALSATLALLLLAPTARAQLDPSTRSQARTYAEAGLAREAAGDCAGAVAQYELALRLVEMPTVAVLAGACLAKLGRLVEASERYRSARGMLVDPSLPADFKNAQLKAKATAEVERAALEKRIPQLLIALEGAAPADVQLLIDGKVVPVATIGFERPVNPGAHHVEVRRGTDVAARDVTLAEGAHERVVLSLPVRAEPPPVAAPAPPAPVIPAPPAGDRAGGTQRVAGIVVAAIGGAGLVVGGVTWGVAFSKRSALDTACPDLTCHGDPGSTLTSYNTLRATTIASLVIGGTALGAGVITFATAPANGAPKVALSPWVGPGLAGVRGSF